VMESPAVTSFGELEHLRECFGVSVISRRILELTQKSSFLRSEHRYCRMAIMLRLGVAFLSILAIPALAQSTIKDAGINPPDYVF
jgi:hypothetical protein